MITIRLPLSFKKKATSAESLIINNDGSALSIDLKMESDFDLALDQVKSSARHVNNYLRLYASYYLTKILAKLPMVIYKGISDNISKK